MRGEREPNFAPPAEQGAELSEKDQRKKELSMELLFESAGDKLSRKEKAELPTNAEANLIAEVVEEDTALMVGDWARQSGLYPEEEEKENPGIAALEYEAAMPVKEAVSNGIFHGNLELPGKIEPYSNPEEPPPAIEESLKKSEFANRKVQLNRRITEDGIFMVTVRDEGPGFEVREVPDPTDPNNRLKESGRGLFYMVSFYDKVDFTRLKKGGMEVRMSKDLKPKEPDEEEGQLN